MALSDHIVETLRKELLEFESQSTRSHVGRVLEVADGIARVSGLGEAKMSEMVVFESVIKEGTNEEGVMGLILNLEEDAVGVAILGDFSRVREGDTVRATGKVLSVPVSEKMIGRVINPLGIPVDGKGAIGEQARALVEQIAPGVITREPVRVPLETGIKAIDAMIPIGRGQRELIIGDRQTGKTQVAIDTIINQKGKGVLCIYVSIGQKESKVARIARKLEEHGALAHTIMVVAGASDPASLQYLAPYSGCGIGEFFMSKGGDVLVVYDDLSKHAQSYRQISLLLKRPPGREAYPGDVFYLHSRLLERACKLNREHGGGSLTALPIIETQGGDVSAYIPTNVISITDGQIYLESDLFYQGVRPALNVGLSVSRVGSAAQAPAMKKVAGKLRLEIAQYRELAAFAQFAQDLDPETRTQIERGKRLVEVLKQGEYAPLPLAQQVVTLYAATNGYFDVVPPERIRESEQKLHQFMETSQPEVYAMIRESRTLGEKEEEALNKALQNFQAVMTQ